MNLTEQQIKNISDYYVTGHKLAFIAQEFNIDTDVIKQALNIVYERLKQDLLCGFDDAVIQQLAKIDKVETEAWASYELSKRPKVIKSQRAQKGKKIKKDSDDDDDKDDKDKGAGNAPDMLTQTQVIEERDPNPIYLNLISRCIDQRLTILRLK